MELCNEITYSLLYISNDEGEKLNLKPFKKNADLRGLPNLDAINFKIDEEKMLKYMAENEMT